MKHRLPLTAAQASSEPRSVRDAIGRHRYRDNHPIAWWIVNLFLFSRHQAQHRMRYGAWTVADVRDSLTWSPFNCLGQLRQGLAREGWVMLGVLTEGEGP